MLASQIAWYSGVSGGCCAAPPGFEGSHWMPVPRGRLHCACMSGYLDSSCASAATGSMSAAASTIAFISSRNNMVFTPLGQRRYYGAQHSRPAEPPHDGAAHHPVLVLLGQERQLLGEMR